jgi:hypothetical protein
LTCFGCSRISEKKPKWKEKEKETSQSESNDLKYQKIRNVTESVDVVESRRISAANVA